LKTKRKTKKTAARARSPFGRSVFFLKTAVFYKNSFNRAFGLPREGETRREDGLRHKKEIREELVYPASTPTSPELQQRCRELIFEALRPKCTDQVV
jgi:hypothetical protein